MTHLTSHKNTGLCWSWQYVGSELEEKKKATEGYTNQNWFRLLGFSKRSPRKNWPGMA